MNRDEYKPDGSMQDTPEWLRSLKDGGRGFQVPEDYFKNFPDQLLEKIQREEKSVRRLDNSGNRTGSVIRRLAVWSAAAAASFLLLMSIWDRFGDDQMSGGPEASYSLEEIPAEDALAYLMSKEESYNWRELVELNMVSSEGEEEIDWMENIDTEEILDELDEDLLIELL